MTQLSGRAGKISMLIMIGSATMLALAVGLVAGPRLLKHKPAASAKDKTEKHEAKSADAKGEKSDGKATKTEGDGEGAEIEHTTVIPLGDFLVNLASGTNVRYLRAEVAMVLVGLPEKKKGGHGGGKGPAIPEGDVTLARDRVVAALSAGDFEALRSAAGKEKLKGLVLKKLAEALPQYKISEVLFTSFVMQ